MKTKFVNREKELNLLDEEFLKSKVIVLFGRRRVGKTELIKRWGRNNEVLYSQAIEADESIQLNQVYEDVRDLLPLEVYPQSWPDLLKLFSQIRKKSAVIIDEFPYLVESNPSLPSIVQRWIDHDQPDNVSLILLGSSQSMMHGLFLDTTSPLYGRAHRIIHIKPMSYKSFTRYLAEEPSKRDIFIKYSVTGGIPKYWEYIEPKQNAAEFIDQIFNSDFSYFENEPQRILKDEKVRGLRPLSILEAIGRGAAKPSEIAKRLNVPQTDLSRSLHILSDTSIIARELPFEESVRSTKRVMYRIADHTLRFWFNIFSPHRSRWHLYSDKKKENIITEHAGAVLEREFRVLYRDAARYWESGDIEFDCIRYADQTLQSIIITEIKWRRISKKEKNSIITNMQKRYKASSLSKKFKSVDFEVLSFEDVVARM
jgi:uncharacterized protein